MAHNVVPCKALASARSLAPVYEEIQPLQWFQMESNGASFETLCIEKTISERQRQANVPSCRNDFSEIEHHRSQKRYQLHVSESGLDQQL